jgi:hypothetical protein
MREAECVPDAVDPTPVIDERLKALAAEHEPRIAAFKRAVAEREAGAKRELRRAQRTYKKARREVERMRHSGVAW